MPRPAAAEGGKEGAWLDRVLEQRTEGGGWQRGLALTSLSPTLIQLGATKASLRVGGGGV